MARKLSPLVQSLIDGTPLPTGAELAAERRAKVEASRAQRPQTLADLREREARGRERHARAAATAQAERAAVEAASRVRPVPAPVVEKKDEDWEAFVSAERETRARNGKMFRARNKELADRAATERKRLGVDE